MLYAVVFAVCLVGSSLCFMPDKFNAVEPRDATNHKLTRIAIYEASAMYVETVKMDRTHSRRTPTEILAEYFQDDTLSMKRFTENARDLGKKVTQVKRDWPKHPARNMNGERIVRGNTLLQAFKTEIIKQLKDNSSNVEQAKDLVAAYLYTLQEFYSNTNWVEMKGAVHYKDLGNSGTPIMATADVETLVCKSCPNYDGSPPTNDPDSCKSNLLRSDLLTSGYKGDQLVDKPTEYATADEGKCSHGGKPDSSRFTVATGGINKETSDPTWSPHHHLYISAGIAAQSASTNFFFGEDMSLVNLIPSESFESLMSLNRGTSIVFVVDDTGSMADEIAGVRKWTINKVQETAGTSKAPYDYILSTFNDPVSLNTIMSTKDSEEMIAQLEKLYAHGGGDCPEMAMHGLIAALELCRPQSNIFVFTDAPAKDEELLATVFNLANQKNARIDFLLTPGCGRKKRAVSDKTARIRSRRSSGMDLYSQIAQETGGNVYFTTDAEFDETLVVIDESLSSNPIEMLQKAVESAGATTLDIPVDEQVSVLTIELSGASSISDASLFNPNGTEETFSLPNDTKSMISTSIMMLKKAKPAAGEWKLKWKVGLSGSVFVRGNGEITFSYTLRERGEDGLLYPIDGQPISGQEYTVAVELEESDKILSLDYLLVVKDGGDIIESIKIDTTSTDSFTANIRVTSEAFKLAVNGTDTSGFRFIRLVNKLVRPLSVKMELLPFTDDFITEESLNITFKLTNVGSNPQNVVVKLSHSLSVRSVYSEKSVTVEANATSEGYFEITAGTAQSLVDVELASEIEGTVMQEITRQLLIIDPYAPVCTEIIHETCGLLPEAECASSSWIATFTMYEKGFGLRRISTSSANGDIQFEHNNFTNGFKGSVNGTISASCCSNAVEIHGEDLGGAVGSCFFSHQFLGTSTTTAELIPTERVDSSSKNHAIVIAAYVVTGVVCAAVITIFAIIIVCKRKDRNKTKVKHVDAYANRRDATTTKISHVHNATYPISAGYPNEESHDNAGFIPASMPPVSTRNDDSPSNTYNSTPETSDRARTWGLGDERDCAFTVYDKGGFRKAII